jgi:hypothetical protein
MAGAFEFSPWRSLSGGAGETVTQSQREWPDAADYADGIIWGDVKAISNATLTVETAPTDVEAYFQPIESAITTAGTVMLVSRFATATTPIMRYLRWKVTGASAWSITFRLYGVLKNS